MELCPINLAKWFSKNPNRSLQQCKQMLKQIAAGLEYLHGQPIAIMHRDLKPENILIDASGVCKIADFDITVTHSATRGHTFPIGTPLYAAPEQVDPEFEGAYNLKVDIYAFGIILMEFYTSFANLWERTTAIGCLRSGTIPNRFFANFGIEQNSDYYGEVKQLCLSMTEKQSNLRPNITEVIRQLC